MQLLHGLQPEHHDLLRLSGCSWRYLLCPLAPHSSLIDLGVGPLLSSSSSLACLRSTSMEQSLPGAGPVLLICILPGPDPFLQASQRWTSPPPPLQTAHSSASHFHSGQLSASCPSVPSLAASADAMSLLQASSVMELCQHPARKDICNTRCLTWNWSGL